jgi:hypothetical protein
VLHGNKVTKLGIHMEYNIHSRSSGINLFRSAASVSDAW